MLSLKPNCEYCDKDLPPHSTHARICSYECTFCTDCVDEVLKNVCPNCGGGFESRPIRPAKAYRPGVSIDHQAASSQRVHKKYSSAEIGEFSESLKNIDPAQR